MSDFSPFMTNNIQVRDGASWQTILQTSFPAVTDTAWTQQVFDISAFSNAALQVRWGLEVGAPGAVIAASWSVDDVCIANSAELASCGPNATAVPEPTTLLLLGSGLAVAAYRRRRR